MKIYISNYRNHWVSPYTMLEKIFFWKPWAQENGPAYPEWVERWSDGILPISKALQWCLDRIRPRIMYVKIDKYDTWNMDSTLAVIILPMLQQLKKEKHGSPLVDPLDCPEELYPEEEAGPNNGYTDSSLHERWAWALDELIWTFEHLHPDNDWEAEFHTDAGFDQEGYQEIENRISNGLRLFGRYYRGLWD
jgi:hypothetical protein